MELISLGQQVAHQEYDNSLDSSVVQSLYTKRDPVPYLHWFNKIMNLV